MSSGSKALEEAYSQGTGSLGCAHLVYWRIWLSTLTFPRGLRAFTKGRNTAASSHPASQLQAPEGGWALQRLRRILREPLPTRGGTRVRDCCCCSSCLAPSSGGSSIRGPLPWLRAATAAAADATVSALSLRFSTPDEGTGLACAGRTGGNEDRRRGCFH